jgi:7-cyano-7-deazaguanine synthase in queuosine biosynthesis
LKTDGSIVAWGSNEAGQCNVPAPNANFVAIAAGELHSLGLKGDGSIMAWGANWDGQCNVPAPNTNFIAIAGGLLHSSLGLKADGSIVAWGWNEYGQCDVPAPNADFVALAGGAYHSLGLKADGSIVAWGSNEYGQCSIPAPNAGFMALAAGGYSSLGLKSMSTGIEAPDLVSSTPSDIQIHALSPNPFNPSTLLSFATSIPGQMTLGVFDLAGRQVMRRDLGTLGTGFHHVRWDGRSSDGHNVASGIYVFQLSHSSGESRTVKGMLLR